MIPSATDVRSAADRLRGVIVRTPLERSASLSALAGTDVHLKCEQRQRTGSFKLRGAYNALATLSPEARTRGVVASSAGNHGLGVAFAARALGIPARIFVPANAPDVKRNGIIALGADVDATQPHYDAAHHAAIEHGREHGLTFVNPCAGDPILAGQGTVALEILEALPSLRTIVVPVGGGGLVGGIAALLREEAPSVRIVGVQGDNTNAMAVSLAAGRRVDVPTPPTLADGLTGQIDDEAFAIGRFSLDDIVTVSEEEIAESIAWLAREHDTRVEGSGAVAVAAVLFGRVMALEGPLVMVVSGGNIDEGRWKAIVKRG